VTITEALRADRRVVTMLIERTNGSIAGTLRSDDLQALGYDVPDGYVLRAWPFEHRQGRDGFMQWATTGEGGPQPILFNNRFDKVDWLIVGAGATVLGLGVAGFAGVGPLAGSSGAAAAGGTAAAAGGGTGVAAALDQVIDLFTGGGPRTTTPTTTAPVVMQPRGTALDSWLAGGGGYVAAAAIVGLAFFATE